MRNKMLLKKRGNYADAKSLVNHNIFLLFKDANQQHMLNQDQDSRQEDEEQEQATNNLYTRGKDIAQRSAGDGERAELRLHPPHELHRLLQRPRQLLPELHQHLMVCLLHRNQMNKPRRAKTDASFL